MVKAEKFAVARVRPLTQKFFARDAREVASALLGKVLVSGRGRNLRAGRLVEVEAYLGESDAAAHAAAGMTKRNAVLFGEPGRAYVYLIYGQYFCLNVACQPEGLAGCVLFRALEPLAGFAAMARDRGVEFDGSEKGLRSLSSGPGRMAAALGVTRERHNFAEMFRVASGLWIGDDGFVPQRVAATTRIGVTSEPARHWLLRYVIAGNGFVSGKKL